ncbi:MAG: helix-turn-helix domain-containing protein [Flavobacterium sp.]|nr:helix-turn-helix domain-containing protein [Flavobacterium sp.]
MILNKLKKHFNFKNDFEFAKYLGIEQNTLSSWKKRDTLNYDTIIAKCTDVKAILILTGKDEEFNLVLKSNEATFKEGLNTSELELLKKELETTRTILESKNETIDMQRDLVNNLKAEIQRLTTEIELLKNQEKHA